MCTGPEWVAARRLEVPGTELFVDLDAIFARIGERA